MADNGRLIINERGECVQVFRGVDHSRDPHTAVIVQMAVLADRVTTFQVSQPLLTSELSLARYEAKALILKLADALGLACELQDKQATIGNRTRPMITDDGGMSWHYARKIVPAKPGREG
jgi:hypothetical protein